MSIARKLIGTTDVASGPAVYVEDVFSTHLYTGTGASRTITNGIDLATKGGLVWIKMRNAAESPALVDTARGASKYLMSDSNSIQFNIPDFTGFSTTGYTLGSDVTNKVNASSKTYVSWTFAKQPKFFDVVTFTAAGSNAEALPHSLGVVPGMVILKKTNAVDAWYIKHRGITGNIDGGYLFLNNPNQANIYSYGTSTSSTVNLAGFVTPGDTYVAYLFAHDTSTDGLIQCGNYTGNGSASGPTVTLGWEPQFVMIKNTSASGGWNIFDNMRGIATGGNDPYLFANSSAAEATTNGDLIDLTSTGFVIKSTSSEVNTSGNNYIYLAIRRGPMKTPTDATKVFMPVARTGTGTTTQITSVGFPADLYITKSRSSALQIVVRDRLRGNVPLLQTHATSEENATTTAGITSFDMQGFTVGADNIGFLSSTTNSSTIPYINWLFRRAPGFFDIVNYSGLAAAQTINHSLGVVPELIFVKIRNQAFNWCVYNQTVGQYHYLQLQGTNPPQYGDFWNFESPTTSIFNLGANAFVNDAGNKYVAYLFASCPGVSKVGSYTGNGSSQTIDCGFTSGARFVLIKRTDAAGDWYVWDTARGIVAGNDPHLSLNSSAAEVTTNDTIDPASSGFVVNQDAATNVNVSSAKYIYLAIA